jgi:hypothetical protein
MATRDISLTPEQDPSRRREDAVKLKALRRRIKAGADALARGDHVEIGESELDGFLEDLEAPPRHRARK